MAQNRSTRGSLIARRGISSNIKLKESLSNIEALAADRQQVMTPLSNSQFTKISEIDYQKPIDQKLFDQLRERNVSVEVKMEFKKQKLLETLKKHSKDQEELRKANILLAQSIDKQTK